jgi:hypothetical protein
MMRFLVWGWKCLESPEVFYSIIFPILFFWAGATKCMGETESRGMTLAKASTLPIDPCSQAFLVCFLFCFWDRVSLTLPQLALTSRSSCDYLPSSYDNRYAPPHLAPILILYYLSISIVITKQIYNIMLSNTFHFWPDLKSNLRT